MTDATHHARWRANWLHDNLTILSATAFLTGIHINMVNVVWQPYVLRLGASMTTLGWLTSLGGFGGIVTSLIQPIGGWLADQKGRKPFVVLASVALIAAYALYTLAGVSSVWTWLIPGVILLGLSGLNRPARAALNAESVAAEKRGVGFSIVQIATMLPGIFAPVLGGYIADHSSATAIFPVSIAFEIVALFLIARYLKETQPPAARVAWGELWPVIKRSVLPPPGLGGFFLCLAGDLFVWSLTLGTLFGMFSKTYGLTGAQLGLLTSAMSITMVVAQLPIGRLVDRYGCKPSMAISEALGIPLMLMWAFCTRFEWLVASYVLFGIVGATWGPAVMTYLAARVPAQERAAAVGRLAAFRGVLSFPAPFIGSVLFEWGGIRLPVLITLAGAVLVTLGVVVLIQETAPAALVQPTARQPRLRDNL